METLPLTDTRPQPPSPTHPFWIYFLIVVIAHGLLILALGLGQRVSVAPAEGQHEVIVQMIAFAPVDPQDPVPEPERSKVLPDPPRVTAPTPPSVPESAAEQVSEIKLAPEVALEARLEPEPSTAPARQTTPAPAAAPKPSARTESGSVATTVSSAASFDAGYLNNPSPQYPPQAFRARAEGTVILRAEVLPSGQGSQIQVQTSSGHKLLDEAALATVKQWRFKPAMQNGKPVSQWVTIPIQFRLNKR